MYNKELNDGEWDLNNVKSIFKWVVAVRACEILASFGEAQEVCCKAVRSALVTIKGRVSKLARKPVAATTFLTLCKQSAYDSLILSKWATLSQLVKISVSFGSSKKRAKTWPPVVKDRHANLKQVLDHSQQWLPQLEGDLAMVKRQHIKVPRVLLVATLQSSPSRRTLCKESS